MNIAIKVPEQIPRNILKKRISEFEASLANEAKEMVKPQKGQSKWVNLVNEIKAMDIPEDVCEHIRGCSKEFREDFSFKHDFKE